MSRHFGTLQMLLRSDIASTSPLGQCEFELNDQRIECLEFRFGQMCAQATRLVEEVVPVSQRVLVYRGSAEALSARYCHPEVLFDRPEQLHAAVVSIKISFTAKQIGAAQAQPPSSLFGTILSAELPE
jgi:hypothetical protein